MNINEMIEALEVAYSMACNETFSESTNYEIIDTIHLTCVVNYENIINYNTYLALTPHKLENLFKVIKKVLLEELLTSGTVGKRMFSYLIRLFDINLED